MTTKLCPRCKQSKPVDDFARNRARKDGVQPYCRLCWNAMQRKPREHFDNAKRCRHCGAVKPLSQFNKSPSHKDGLTSHCKDCIRQYHKQWRDKNRESVLRHKREYYQRTKPERQKHNQEYHERNRARRNAYTSTYLSRHPEMRRAVKHKRRAAKVAQTEHYTAKDITEKMISQDGKCFWCHSALVTYHADHVVPLSKGGTNAAANIVLSCPTCNLRKKDKSLSVWLVSVDRGQ